MMFEVGETVTVSSSEHLEFEAPFRGEVVLVQPSPFAAGETVYSIKGEAVRVLPDGERQASGGWGNVPESALSHPTTKAQKTKMDQGAQE